MNTKQIFDIDFARLLIEQHFPQFADLEVKPILSGGTDNAVFRLGEKLLIRLPAMPYAAGQLAKEIELLPRFSHLSLSVPELIGVGNPTQQFDANWCIYAWIKGQDAVRQPLENLNVQAAALASFLLDFRQVSPLQKYAAGNQNHSRGVALSELDKPTRRSISTVSDEFDASHLLGLWKDALAATEYAAPPVWLHGDLHAGNMIANKAGKLTAIIDFGLAGVGDPSVDLMPAWWVFDGKSRAVFKQALGVDEADWARGQGWALSVALNAYAYYRGSKKTQLAKMSRRAICEIIDQRSI